MHPFRRAIEARDLDAAVALLHEDVVFKSPVVFTPYQGRESLRVILGAVLKVFEDFRYVREIGADDARDHALVFDARVGDKLLEGCDFIRLDDNGAKYGLYRPMPDNDPAHTQSRGDWRKLANTLRTARVKETGLDKTKVVAAVTKVIWNSEVPITTAVGMPIR